MPINKELVDRINALARKQKAEGLNEEEKLEQAELRGEYLRSFRDGMAQILDQVWIQDEDGTYEKLQKKQKN